MKNLDQIIKGWFLATLAISLSGCGKIDDVRKERLSVSIVAIVADPDRFHGKTVAISGYYMRGRETSGIFASREMSFVEANGLWVDLGGDFAASSSEAPPALPMQGTAWLYAEGIIDASSGGHDGVWAATIRVKKLRVFPVNWIDDRTR